MEGREQVSIDGGTRVEWVPGPSGDAQRIGSQRVSSGIGEDFETLRAGLIAATVEVLAEGSDRRLGESRPAPTAA